MKNSQNMMANMYSTKPKWVFLTFWLRDSKPAMNTYILVSDITKQKKIKI